MKDRVCLVTGATSGIGKRAALLFAQEGATVILHCRNRERGEPLLKEVVETTGNRKVELWIADLSLQSSIREAASAFLEQGKDLHVLVNNAGLAVRTRTLTSDGIEMTFAVNYLASFLLTNLLLKRLQASAPARIINVSSEAHRNVKPDFFENLQGEKKFSGFGAYSITKLCNILFTIELSSKLAGTGVTVNAIHPGYLNTDIFRNAPGFLRFLVRLTAGNPDQGAEGIVHLSNSADLEGVSGKYFDRKKMASSSSMSLDSNAAHRLWELSAQLTGLERMI